jgi:diaminohydroxyphosphoribosylaminopyrimidine deaminase/5-amino-6-(5-phosphoribosylamino)uracil reductase
MFLLFEARACYLSQMSADEIFMLRAQDLARLGQGAVSPNPMVGCVVVCDGKIIGEGWHRKFGEPHAEVNAIHSVENKEQLPSSVIYVNLEPCSHHGKTPPCTDLLLLHGVKKVVISNIDINPLVAGKGIARLREHHVEVITGVLQEEGKELNKRFFTFMARNRPFILLKWAQTEDGFMAHENYESKWITNGYSRQLVHKWRSEEDAVLVGTRTARHDDPRLNVRDWTGRNPVRVVIDRSLRLTDDLHLFDRSQPTLCYNLVRHEDHSNLVLVRIGEAYFLEEMLHDMFQRGIQSVMVEGGSETLMNFIDKGLWDEARVFQSSKIFNKGILAPVLKTRSKSKVAIKEDHLSFFINESAQ